MTNTTTAEARQESAIRELADILGRGVTSSSAFAAAYREGRVDISAANSILRDELRSMLLDSDTEVAANMGMGSLAMTACVASSLARIMEEAVS